MEGQSAQDVKLASITAATPVLARRPRSLAEAGLSEAFVSELVLKHLYHSGATDISGLSRRIALAGSILEPIVMFLRNQAWVEPLPGGRVTLTDRGRAEALETLRKSGYLGPAPVPLEQYRKIVAAQSVTQTNAHRDAVRDAFSDVVAHQILLDRLGVAVNSKRAILMYGPPGTGKTYLGSRLARLLGEPILIPHAILVGYTPIQFFDPSLHRMVTPEGESASALLDEGHDPRFVRCERPAILTGGELTLDMLEIAYDAPSNTYHAPHQLMANNGMFMIDDLGRQRMTPDALLNRWVVPMEEHKDYLTIGSGQRFEVPFDVTLIFSTNLNPLKLADEAFLRRLGNKVRFRYTEPDEYREIWQRFCEKAGLKFDEAVLGLVYELYKQDARPMLPCHPRDLLLSVVDQKAYQKEERNSDITRDEIQRAWDNYFVPLKGGV